MKRPQLVIYGNGHMARMLAEIVSSSYETVAFTVDRELISRPEFCGLPLVPFDGVETFFPPARCSMLIAVGYVGMNSIRMERAAAARARGYKLINHIDKTARLYPSTDLGDNNVILEYAVLHPGSQVGSANFIGSNVNLGHGTLMADGCWLNSGVAIGGEVQLGNGCVFGMNASAAHGISVGEKTFVAANTFLADSSSEGAVFLSERAIKHRLRSETFLRLLGVV